jgi:hypothetical protein
VLCSTACVLNHRCLKGWLRLNCIIYAVCEGLACFYCCRIARLTRRNEQTNINVLIWISWLLTGLTPGTDTGWYSWWPDMKWTAQPESNAFWLTARSEGLMWHPSNPEGIKITDTRNARRPILQRESVHCPLKVCGPGQEQIVSQLGISHCYFPISSVHINFEICSWIPQMEPSVGTYYETFRLFLSLSCMLFSNKR